MKKSAFSAVFLAGAAVGLTLPWLFQTSAEALTRPQPRRDTTGSTPIATLTPSPSPAPAPPAKGTQSLAPIVLLEFETGWTTTSAGRTDWEGDLWVPEIRTVVKNPTLKEIPRVWLRAIFLDEQLVITSEQVTLVEKVPPGWRKGPIFLTGKAGYPGDSSLEWMNDPARLWRYELFQGASETGPWTRIGAGVVKLAADYQPIAHR
jgi:hypothetical protein